MGGRRPQLAYTRSAVALVVALSAFLVAYGNVVGLYPGSFLAVPINVLVAAALVAVARGAGLSWDAIGLGRAGFRPGLRWGFLIVLAVAVVVAVILAIPQTRGWLADRRLAGAGPGRIGLRALVQIPLGTVLLEEVAFRGVLLGAWMRHGSVLAAVIGSSAVFGLWHLAPAIDLVRANVAPPLQVLSVASGVVLSGVGGALFAFLRLSTGGIIGPAVAHWGLNAIGIVAAYLALRSGREPLL